VPSIFLIGRFYQTKGNEVDPYVGDVRIVSYNVGLFVHDQDRKSGLSRMELADTVSAFLRGTGAEIICLQEFHLPLDVNMDNYFRTRFPGYHADYYVLSGDKGRAGNVTLSKFPVLSKGKIDFEHSTNMALHTDIDVNGTRLRVYNCHFESYNISLPAMVKSIRDDNELEAKGRRIKHTITQRPEQVEAVMKDIEACPVHSVVTGDFNDNPLSYTYHRLSQGRKDSFVEVGEKVGATYSALWPMLRIDYILYPEELTALWHEVRKVRYSDHYPVIASFSSTAI